MSTQWSFPQEERPLRRHRARTRSQQSSFDKFIKTPKAIVLILLLLLMVVGCIHGSDRPGVLNILVAMATASLVDLLVGMARNNKRLLPDGGMVTGLIIGLVLSASVKWYIVVVTAGIAMASKHLLKTGRKPIFNPAAFALLASLFVFHTGQSWWGDLSDLPTYYLPILVLVGYFITHRVNKFPQVFTYLGTYFLTMTLAIALHAGNPSYTPADAIQVPLVNSALFMAFFMLTDPPTSPGTYGEQVTFSVVAAVVGVVIYLVFGGLSYLLIGLLAANAWRAIGAARKKPKDAHRAH